MILDVVTARTPRTREAHIDKAIAELEAGAASSRRLTGASRSGRPFPDHLVGRLVVP